MFIKDDLMENEKRATVMNSGTIFVGCMFIGLGLGFLLNAVTPGVLIGMGVGFIAMSIAKPQNRDTNKSSD